MPTRHAPACTWNALQMKRLEGVPGYAAAGACHCDRTLREREEKGGHKAPSRGRLLAPAVEESPAAFVRTLGGGFSEEAPCGIKFEDGDGMFVRRAAGQGIAEGDEVDGIDLSLRMHIHHLPGAIVPQGFTR